MITKNEISSLNLSPTNKDFVQIWNELIEVASKITERWDPTSTNESDPGIVLLKVLAGIADKLNYNIDKNILEAYMPTAAQMESMRKLCELVGYDIKYYQSATTKVKISYVGNTADIEGNDERLPVNGLALPKFTTITNADKDISFITTNAIPALLTNSTPWVVVDCIEGQICQCESINEHNLITLDQLDENNRYYLPEVQIAENGIFVYNASESLEDGTPWEQISNLNTRPLENRVFKFGYDSFVGRPYLAFPDDIGSLIGDGLFIYFTRTSGLNGNISQRRLEAIELPDSKWGEWENYSVEQFEVVNEDATSNGANIESISKAYNNFKKTVGTFDTLVTCRDYMNKIYSLMNASNLPYVSNILVTDIRNDINKAITLCSCNEYGILYKELPLTTTVYVGSSIKAEDPDGDNTYKLIINRQPDNTIEQPLIDHFDLLLYPFKTFTQVSSGTEDLTNPYNTSFTYTEQLNSEIDAELKEFKTCAHNLTTPSEGDVVAINNYLRLNAHIATSARISEIEANAILKNVRVALVNAFNMRNLDFGEEIPFDSILSVIENADSRIKVVSLQEPTILTTYSVKEGIGSDATSKEYGIASTAEAKIEGVNYTYIDEDTKEEKEYTTAKKIYNQLVLRNILAGRASLLEYDETFIANNTERPYTVTKDISAVLEAIIKKASDEELSYEDSTALSELIKDLVSTNLTDTDIDDELAERLDDLKSKAEEIKSAAASYESPCEVVLSSKGLHDGIVTLKNIMVDKIDPDTGDLVMVDKINPDTGETVLDPDTFEPVQEVAKVLESEFYETFEPGFDTNSGSTPLEKTKGGVVDNVDRVEATCELTNTTNIFQHVTLGKNEVIKFRAPNLITTTTYPAYVYYRFERANLPDESETQSSTPQAATFSRTRQTTTFAQTNSSSASNTGGYADIMSLSSFINAYAAKDGKDKAAENLNTFFKEFWTLAETRAITKGTKVGTKETKALKAFTWSPPKEGEEPESSSIQQSASLQQILNSSIAIGTSGTEDIDPSKVKKVFTNIKEFNDFLEKEQSQNPMVFIYYPFWDSTMPIWAEHVRNCYTELYPGKELPEGTTFWRLSNTSGHPKGKYVTESGQRLYAQGGDFLQNTIVGDTTYLCKDAGSSPTYSAVSSGSDIELRPGSSGGSKSGGGGSSNTETAGDRLYIHYTPSSTNEDGETVTAEPVSLVFESTTEYPIIVRPSGFTLIPSEDLVRSQGLSWKKTGVKFTLKDGTVVTKDLLALAPNEQIEMRDISRVVLDSPARFYKNFKNAVLEGGDPNEHPYSYELKDGEYIFYTDQNASNAAYYGSGSVITVDGGAKIPAVSETIEVSQILEQGLHVVPWSRVELLGGNKKVTVTEYQYVTLVEGDILNTVTLDNKSNTIGSDWTPCLSDTDIIYTPAKSETSITLPKISIPSEANTTQSTSWEVRSFLELSTSPGYSQPLRAAQANTPNGLVSIKDTVTLHINDETGADKTIVITPQKGTNMADPDKLDYYEPVSIKLDTIVQTASGNFEKEKKEDSKEDSKICAKVFKEETPAIVEFDSEQEITPISNIVSSPVDSKNNITDIINNYWFKLDVKNALISSDENKNKALKLNFMIPDAIGSDLFGIFSIYFDAPEGNLNKESKQNIPIEDTRVYIDVPKEFGPFGDVINIYNVYNYKNNGLLTVVDDNNETISKREGRWWSEGIDSNKGNRLYLRAGLNCIVVKKSCNILIGAESNADGSLIYDNLRLVRGKAINGVNLKLLDPDMAFNKEVNRIAQLEAKIAEIKQDLSYDMTELDSFYKAELEAFEKTKVRFASEILECIEELDKNHEFYYNVPVENSVAIEFDNNIKSFSNPHTLYDVNNINNNFVISKLDIEYLGDENNPGGIRIAKSSRY